MPSKVDTIKAALVAAGHTTGSAQDGERKRLLALLGLTEPQKLSLYDLYSRAGERPRL